MKKMGQFIWGGALVASLSLASVSTARAVEVDLKGSFRVRGERSDFTDYQSHRAFGLMRFRPDATFKVSPEIRVFFQPQFTKVFGEQSYVTSTPTTNSLQTTSGTTYDTTLSVHQGYFWYQPYDGMQFTIGRQVLAYGDELVIGGLDWHNISRSFDALKLKYTYSLGYTDLFYSKLLDTNAAADGTGDYEFWGLYNGWDFGEYLKEADFYILYLKDERGVIPPQTNVWTFGLRLKSKIGMFDYRAEADYQIETGSSNRRDAWQSDAEFGYTFGETWKPRLGLGGFVSTKHYNQLFPTVHKWLGTADVFGRRNLSGFVIRTSVAPSPAWLLSLDFHKFYRTELTDGVYRLAGTSMINTGSPSDDIGMEFDLHIRKQVTDNLAALLGGSVFLPGTYFRDMYGARKPGFAFAQMEVKF